MVNDKRNNFTLILALLFLFFLTSCDSNDATNSSYDSTDYHQNTPEFETMDNEPLTEASDSNHADSHSSENPDTVKEYEQAKDDSESEPSDDLEYEDTPKEDEQARDDTESESSDDLENEDTPKEDEQAKDDTESEPTDASENNDPTKEDEQTSESTEQAPTDSSKEMGEVHIVEIKNFSFSPNTLEINVGDSVLFINKDNMRHSATADDQSFDSGSLNQNNEYKVSFSKTGEITYFCTPHPDMTGKIVVLEKNN